MTGGQERRAAALQAIDRFCEKNGVKVPALEEKRVENRVEFRGTVLHNGEPATFGIAYEVEP